jgi:excisionase family DNA binding protein
VAPRKKQQPRPLPAVLWTTKQTAEYLSVPVQTLYLWRYHGTGPEAYRVGKHLRYDPADVLRWLQSNVA